MRSLQQGLALALAALVVACGSSSTAHSKQSPSITARASAAASPTSLPFPSPSPGTTSAAAPASLACTSAPAAGEHLALVTLHGLTGIVVRDITDINHPVSRCTFSEGSQFRFYDATHVSYIATVTSAQGSAGALYVADLTAATTRLVRAWTNGGYGSWIYAWSPDGRELSYLSSDGSGLGWHILSAAGDKVLSNLGQVVPRDVSGDNDDTMVGFSADGQYVAVETTITNGKAGPTTSAAPIQVARVADGSLAYSRTDGTMAAWAGAGSRLYFRTTSGVQFWSPTGGVISVASLSWIHPIASPDGSLMAFSVLNAQQNHVGEVLDLTANAVRPLSQEPRVGAAFLTASLVWYAGETICTTATPCGLGGPPPSGKTYIWDLSSGVETGSLDTSFCDSWPHVAGQT